MKLAPYKKDGILNLSKSKINNTIRKIIKKYIKNI